MTAEKRANTVKTLLGISDWFFMIADDLLREKEVIERLKFLRGKIDEVISEIERDTNDNT